MGILNKLNPLKTTYGPSAAAKWQKDAEVAALMEAQRQVREEQENKKAKVAAGKVAGAQSVVRKCAKSKVKPGVMKCGAVGTGVYCKKHTKMGTIISHGGK